MHSYLKWHEHLCGEGTVDPVLEGLPVDVPVLHPLLEREAVLGVGVGGEVDGGSAVHPDVGGHHRQEDLLLGVVEAGVYLGRGVKLIQIKSRLRSRKFEQMCSNNMPTLS